MSRQVSQCSCPKRFQVEQVSANRYRVRVNHIPLIIMFGISWDVLKWHDGIIYSLEILSSYVWCVFYEAHSWYVLVVDGQRWMNFLLRMTLAEVNKSVIFFKWWTLSFSRSNYCYFSNSERSDKPEDKGEVPVTSFFWSIWLQRKQGDDSEQVKLQPEFIQQCLSS